MGYSKEIYEAANKKITLIRQTAISEAARRKQAFFKHYPRAREIEKALSSTAIQVARAVLAGNDDKIALLNEFKEKNLRLQSELAEILKKASLPEDYLEVRYNCSLCKDQGHVGGKTCGCLKQLLKKEAYDRLNQLSPLALCTFSSFSLDYYSTIPIAGSTLTPRKRMEDIFRYCRDYAENFTANSPSLLMQGATGLGKTHLSLAIAKAAIDKGYGVIYGSTQNIVTKLEKERFRYNHDTSPAESEQYFIDCDLLILDDLGTEFSTQFSNAAIYNIVNSRIMTGKPTIISTNLSMKELERSYTERLVSRIMGNNIRLAFLGGDVRQKNAVYKR